MGKHTRLVEQFIKTVMHENMNSTDQKPVVIDDIIAALTALAYFSFFNILRLCSSFISIWARKQHKNFSYSYGYGRFEVLAVFISTTITQLSGFIIFKESFERLLEQDKVIADSQISSALLGTVVNTLVTYGVESTPFSSVSRGASSNWIQDALFDIGKSVCGMLPLLSRFLLVRLNPYMLLSHAATIIVIIESLLVKYREAYEADAISAMFIAILICVTMYPLSYHCAMILMHATPKDLITCIDKCLKEANTLDGLLEFRQEHFWSIGFGKFAGSLHVRIRRDANEQLILAQLTNKLAPYLHHVTIQIFKDDWTNNVTSSAHSHTYDTRANLPYVSHVAALRNTLPYSSRAGGARNLLPYASPVLPNIPFDVTQNKSLVRYAQNSFQTESGCKGSTGSPAKEPALRNKFNGPKINLNFY